MTDLTRVVSAGVGPIIVISACGLLCSTFYNRISNVITRLRAFQRERLAEQTALERETDPILRERRNDMLNILGQQTEKLVYRIRLIRRTLFCLLATIASLILCSLALGLSVLVDRAIYAAIGFFILGLTLLLCGVIFAMIDLKMALDPVVLETKFVAKRLRKAERV